MECMECWNLQFTTQYICCLSNGDTNYLPPTLPSALLPGALKQTNTPNNKQLLHEYLWNYTTTSLSVWDKRNANLLFLFSQCHVNPQSWILKVMTATLTVLLYHRNSLSNIQAAKKIIWTSDDNCPGTCSNSCLSGLHTKVMNFLISL